MANDLNQCGDSKKRTPDEIKKGLECNDCKSCPYSEYNNNDGDCHCGEVEGDALSYIQQLEADNAQQARCIENLTDKLIATNDALPHWISVEERLPEELKDVLVYRDGCFAIARIITGDDWTYCGMGGDPTHWMPLPEPPKEG